MSVYTFAAMLLALAALTFSVSAETIDGDFTVNQGENVSFENLAISGELTVNGHLFVKNNLTAQSIHLDGYGVDRETVKAGNATAKIVAGIINATDINSDRGAITATKINARYVTGHDGACFWSDINATGVGITSGAYIWGNVTTVNYSGTSGSGIVGNLVTITNSCDMNSGSGIVAQNFTGNNILQTSGSRITSRNQGIAGNITSNSGAEFNSGNKTLITGNTSIGGYMNAPEVEIKGEATVEGEITSKDIKVGSINNRVEITADNGTVKMQGYWDYGE